MLQVVRYLNGRSAAIALALLILVHIGATFALALTRLYTVHGSFDSVVFDQVFWSMLHGHGPYTTATAPFERLHWFGWHFSPMFYLLLPVYALAPGPEVLQLLQSVLLAGAAWPLYLVARRLGLSAGAGLVLAGAYLGCLPVWAAALWDFHEVALAGFLFGWAYLALFARRRGWFLLCCLLLLGTKEHYGAAVCGLGLYWAWRNEGDRRFGLLVAAFGLAGLGLVVFKLMPWLYGGLHPMLGGIAETHPTAVADSTTRYAWLRGSPQEVWENFRFFFTQGDAAGWRYVLRLLAAGAGLPLAALPALLPGAADFTTNLLSANPMPRAAAAYHSVPLLPVIFIATATMLVQRGPWARRMLLVLVLFGNAASWWLLADEWPTKIWGVDTIVWRRPPEAAAIRHIIGDASLAAQPNAGVFFANRAAIYPYSNAWNKAEYLVFQLSYPYPDADFNPFAAQFAIEPRAHFAQLQALLKDKRYGIVYWQNGWLLLHKGDQDGASRQEVRQTVAALVDAP